MVMCNICTFFPGHIAYVHTVYSPHGYMVDWGQAFGWLYLHVWY